MKTLLSFVAVAALALSFSSTAATAATDGVRMANAQMTRTTITGAPENIPMAKGCGPIGVPAAR